MKAIGKKILSLNDYIFEKLIINRNIKATHCRYFPKTKDELMDIINKLIDEAKNNQQTLVNFNCIDISKLINISAVFENKFPKDNRNTITSIDVSEWDTSNIMYADKLFVGCSNLESVGNLSGWAFPKLRNGNFMFGYCSKLKDIGDISDWNIPKTAKTQNMFLKSGITPPNWD